MIYIKIFNLIYLFSIIRLIFGYNCWYSAGAASSSVDKIATSSITTSNTTVSLGALKLTINIDANVTGNPGPTDSEGNIKVLINGIATQQADSFYDKTGTFQWWVTAEATGNSGSATLVDLLKQEAGTYTVTFSGTNLKFGTNDATAIAGAAADSGTVTATFEISSEGVISVTDSAKATHYVAVSEAQTEKNAAIAISISSVKKGNTEMTDAQ